MVKTNLGWDGSSGDPAAIEPPEWFRAQANINQSDIRTSFNQSWPECWTEAADLLDWNTVYETILDDSNPPFYRWFPDGELNACYNCIDRHTDDDNVAIEWIGNLGETRSYTYSELYDEVNALAAALSNLGVSEDDVVTIYLPVVPELPIAMLACARIGAPHSVVFAGFSADALATRLDAASSEYLITCDGFYRRGDAINQKRRVDDALLQVDHPVDETIVVDRLGEEYPHALHDNEHDYERLIDSFTGTEVNPVSRSAEDMLFLMYTSGTTGKPKGVRHSTGGYLAQTAWTTQAVLDLDSSDTIWTAADIGWITGHSYTVYGPLALGATTVLYEGAPDTPDREHIESVIDEYDINVFYTSATAIRSMMKRHPPDADYDLSSIRLLGTVGEPIGSDAWHWYRQTFGDGETPVVDTWWQTETGSIMISTLPGVDTMKPGAAGPPLPGNDIQVVDPDGNPVDTGQAGYLTINRPWPSMARTVHGSDDRFIEEYWQRFSDPDTDTWAYFTGDGAQYDDEGYIRLLGRVDDVINVSSRRLRTVEIESRILDIEGVTETAVVGGRDEAGRTVVFAYVTTEQDRKIDKEHIREQVKQGIQDAVGELAHPGQVIITPDLPKTRSGKIMRRLLEDISNDNEYGDTSALRNPEIVGEIESALSEE